MERKLMLGHVVGMGKISIEFELRKRKLEGMSIDLRPINGEVTQLTISGSFRGSGGQIVDSLPPLIEQWKECYITQEQLTKLIQYWNKWHLNDTNAGSDFQQSIIDWFYDEEGIKERALIRLEREVKRLDRIVNRYKVVMDRINESLPYYPRNTWKAFDKISDAFDLKTAMLKSKFNKLIGKDHYYMSHYEYCCILLKEHCLYDDCGYKYGSAWLYKALPPEVIQFFHDLTVPLKVNEDERWDWMRSNGIKCKSISRVSNNPNMESEHEMDHWKVKFINEDGNELISFFSTGLGHRLNVQHEDQYFKLRNKLTHYLKWFKSNDIKIINPIDRYITREGLPKPPKPYDVMSALIVDALIPEQYNDWIEMADEYGMSINDKKEKLKAKRIYVNCESMNYQLNDFFNHKFDLFELSDMFRD